MPTQEEMETRELICLVTTHGYKFVHVTSEPATVSIFLTEPATVSIA